jgi:hypothetical protein
VIVADYDPLRGNRTNFRQISRDLTTRNIDTYDGTQVVQDIASTYPKLLPDILDVIR